MRFLFPASLATLSFVLSACGGQTANDPGSKTDAGKEDVSTIAPSHDAASGEDVATGTDSGSPVDTGIPILPPANDGGPTNDAGPGVCPASYALATGDCTDPSAVCDYDKGTCFCTTSPGGLPMGHPIDSDAALTPVWSCSQLSQGCPPNPPTMGTACATDGTTCDYGMCMGGSSITCSGGTWQMGFGACPG